MLLTLCQPGSGLRVHGVKNLLTVLSSRGGRLGGLGGGLGSTRPAATEDKESDKHAEETCSD